MYATKKKLKKSQVLRVLLCMSNAGYGVTFDVETSKTARIMLISLIPFLILQLAKIINSPSGIHVVVLVSLIVTIGLVLAYFIYQIFQPWIQNRRLEFVLRKYIRRNLLQNLLTAGRRPNIPVIREIFHRIDQNGNSYISNSELRSLIVGIQIEESGLRQDDLVARVMEQFDTSQDHQINEQEFVTGLSNWLIVARDSISHPHHGIFRRNSAKTTTEEQQSLIAKNVATQSAANDGRKDWLNYVKAGLLIILGTAITLTLGQPLVGTLVQFSFAANVPSFLISYVVIPLALNFGQAVRAISSAREKTEKAISLMLSEIYNRIFMNNLMGLVGFLALVYIRNVSWDVSAEVLVVLIICTLMGLYTSFSTKFPVWTSIVAFLLYPISLLSLYLLTSVLGWS
ncbi:sodium/calcium exchanger NCL2 [Morus notabilis]|uniref:sodium/calcium exchanger NCL2 n=1 Tax=Morus notabilis TaxID=981085 RepID=UPI000CED6C7A|nr:sodium/calcium exchanger NCL2 [Morus notabilis]